MHNNTNFLFNINCNIKNTNTISKKAQCVAGKNQNLQNVISTDGVSRQCSSSILECAQLTLKHTYLFREFSKYYVLNSKVNIWT